MSPKHVLVVGGVTVVGFAAGFAGARASGGDQKPAAAAAPTRDSLSPHARSGGSTALI